MNKWLIDVESRGKVAFNTGILKTHDEASKYAYKTYHTWLERNCFVAGWNMAFWGRV